MRYNLNTLSKGNEGAGLRGHDTEILQTISLRYYLNCSCG